MAKNTPKYAEVADWLRESIHNGKYKAGEKLISEHSLREKFGVSRHTVRSAISLLENENLLVRKQGSGTYINNGSNTSKQTIGVLLTDATCYTFPDMIAGIGTKLSQAGYNILLSLTFNRIETERSQLLSFQAANIDGLIVEAVQSALANPNIELYRDFIAQGIPVIFINAFYPKLVSNYIVNDDAEGGRIATEHLIEQGHKKIGGLFKLDSIQGGLRYEGFIHTLYEQDLTFDENRILWFTDDTLDSIFSDDQLPQLKKFLDDCTAVLCYSDRVAVKLLDAAKKLQIRVPQDLSIASFDDSLLSKLSVPGITSVTHPGIEMGKLATTSLLQVMKDRKHQIHHTYKPTLTIRDSVARREE
jgi:GntR family transcriptional regulator of arabinose operon